jgi:Na+/melibiose symporter-like transporter
LPAWAEAGALALIGALFGYVSGENPGPDPANAFRFLLSVFPFVCMVLGWVLAWRLDLGRDTMRTEYVRPDGE